MLGVKACAVLVLGATLVVAGPAVADVWDVQTTNDNTNATENELVHGSDQLHDLGVLPGPTADEDWYRISQKAFSSYEVVVDATSGDIGTGLVVDLVDSGGGQVTASQAVGIGYSRSLRFRNTTAASVDGNFVKVSGACGTSCGADDVYRLRAYETTYAIPRFNNAGTQVTVLILQNPSAYTIGGTVYFWSTTGVQLGFSNFSLPAKQTLVLNTATVPGANGVSGAMTVSHDGRYGDLAGKTVALEPSTGFSFDTPMVPRPH